MPNLPIAHVEKPTDLISVIILPSSDNCLINVFIRLNTKVGKRVINEYKRLMENTVIDNQWFVKFFENFGNKGVADMNKLPVIKRIINGIRRTKIS